MGVVYLADRADGGFEKRWRSRWCWPVRWADAARDFSGAADPRRVDHPNIARLSRRHHRAGTPYLVMETSWAIPSTLTSTAQRPSTSDCGFSSRCAPRCSRRTRTSSSTGTSSRATSWSRRGGLRSPGFRHRQAPRPRTRADVRRRAAPRLDPGGGHAGAGPRRPHEPPATSMRWASCSLRVGRRAGAVRDRAGIDADLVRAICEDAASRPGASAPEDRGGICAATSTRSSSKRSARSPPGDTRLSRTVGRHRRHLGGAARARPAPERWLYRASKFVGAPSCQAWPRRRSLGGGEPVGGHGDDGPPGAHRGGEPPARSSVALF